MKKILIVSLAVAFTAMANAQVDEVSSTTDMAALNKNVATNKEHYTPLKKLKGRNVSYQSKEAFYRDFGNTDNTTWERTDNFDKATFTKNGQVMKAFYDDDAELVGTTTVKKLEDLPQNARKTLGTKYKDYTVTDVIFFDDNEYNDTDMTLYGVQFEDEDNYFVDLKKENENIIVQVNMQGNVSFFKAL